MNTKTGKIGARLGAMLLSLCLIMGLLPTTALAQSTGTTIFGYEGSGTWSMASVSAEDQSDYTALTSYDSFDWFYGLEMIDDTIYGVYSSYYNSSYDSELVILNPDLTIQETVGGWLNSSLDIEQIIDTTVQNDTLWGTYNTAEYEYSLEGGELVSTFKSGTSYLIPIDLTTGMADKTQIHQVTGLPEREIIYTIACNESGQMYAIVADGGENGGAASLYTIDTNTFAANKVGDTGVTTNYVSSSTFAPDGNLYWAENNAGKLYTVNTGSGKATAVPGGTIGGSGLSLNAMMIPSNADEVAYVNFVVNGEGTVTMNGQEVRGWQKVTPGSDLSLTFTPGGGSNVKEVVVDGEKMEFIDSYTLEDVSAWSADTHTVEVTFGSRDISINADQWGTQYLGTATLEYHPSFEAGLYFTVSNGPSRKTAAGVSNYEISIEKDGKTIDKSDLVPGTYDIRVTRAEDKYWNALDIVLKDDLIITKQTDLIQWSDLELTANPGDTLADIEKPAYLVSPLDGKQIPGTFYWIDDESTSVGELGDRTGFKFRFVPDPLSDDLAVLYDFSAMPEDGFQGDEWNPYTAYVTVKEESEIPGGTVTPSVTKSRVAGDDRFETAIKVADKLKSELGVVKFNNIVVANSDEFADALSATALAADKDAPILVVNENNESAVKKYIYANLNKGGNVYIIGGTAVVSESFEKSLTGCKVTRLGGSDRYETNLEVLKTLGVTGASDIMVASGLKYPDALSASATGNPVLLVGKTLTDNQKAYLATLGGNDDYYVIGGTAAVNATVMNQLNASKLGTVTRLGGDTRYETGLAVADEFFTNARTVVIASGDDFPDGLTGGVLANAMNAPLMLVNQYNTDVAADYVDDNSVRTVIAIGGTTVIPDATLNKVA